MTPEQIREGVIVKAIAELEQEPARRGFIGRAIREGLLLGFKRSLQVLRIKRAMREDARRLRVHANELREWDVGDDGETAALIDEIAARIEARYGLTIHGASHDQ